MIKNLNISVIIPINGVKNMAFCPHCKKEVNKNNIRLEYIEKKTFGISHGIFSCPHCDYILGVSAIDKGI